MHPLLNTETRKIYTVAEVSRDIRALLEDNFPSFWISGEVSNLKISASGHAYLTLKDDKAQISGVMFRGQLQKLRFNIEDGMELILHARISVYEPRGQYQILIDHAEPKGLGALQLAFEQLKERLSLEGLFDEKHKKPLPHLPQKIGIITSSQGAVVHDLVTIITRRFPGMPLLIHPVRVQGDGAAQEIAAAIASMNARVDLSLLIVGRGGGSLEDLWAFNEEVLVRAVFNSVLPIVSAVGHETDYTLCDLVADLRAPTPSAAAELTVPKREDLNTTLYEKKSSLFFAMRQLIKRNIEQLSFYRRRIKHPRKILEDLKLKLADSEEKIILAMQNFLKGSQNRFRETRLRMPDLHSRISALKIRLNGDKQRLLALSPLSLLKRGYSIVFKDGMALSSIENIKEGDWLSLRLADGEILSVVKGTKKTP